MCVMQIRAYSDRYRLGFWCKFLHLFFAGLYAFVLPTICFGAEATPGHPHARAHFVFVEPLAEVHSELAVAPHRDLPGACHSHSADPTPLSEDDSPAPVGRSVPSQLVLSSLMNIGAVASVLPPNADTTEFPVWLTDIFETSFHALVPTPPPRPASIISTPQWG